MTKLLTLIILSLMTQFSFSQTHIKLVYDGNNENILQSVKKANEILNSKYFYDEIRKIEKFDNSDLTGHEVADRMEKANQKVTVVRKFKPIANASTKTSDKIKISHSLFGKDSTGKFDINIAVNTLIHETVHAVDFLRMGNEFTHNENSPVGQENTAPWVIGDIAEKMMEQNKL